MTTESPKDRQMIRNSTPQSEASEVSAGSSSRKGEFDAYKGIAILAVLTIHLSGNLMSRLDFTSPLMLSAAALNRICQFAVPAFLMLSAFLNGASLLRGTSQEKFFGRRFRRALWPYLLWSAVGIAVSFTNGQFKWTYDCILYTMLWGKAYYHLYFLSLVLQLYLLLPFAVRLFKGRPSFWSVAAGTIAAQGLFYYLNRYVHTIHVLSSMILWFLPVVFLGLWLATREDELPELLRRQRFAAAAIVALSLCIYLPQAVAMVSRHPVNTCLYQVGQWFYSAGASFFLMCLVFVVPGLGRSPLLKYLGVYSMQIYLVHPFVITALDIYFGKTFPLIPAVIIYTAAVIIVPLAVAKMADRAKISPILFGV
ncbi:MAG: acyltransferase [Vulcanimicrobiota bacterium]